jgi:hypothetical protein
MKGLTIIYLNSISATCNKNLIGSLMNYNTPDSNNEWVLKSEGKGLLKQNGPLLGMGFKSICVKE